MSKDAKTALLVAVVLVVAFVVLSPTIRLRFAAQASG